MKLPYFKWYPADAEIDGCYRAMSFAERGFYMSCLNFAWVNGGISADPETRARQIGCGLEEANQLWIRVSPCFERSSGNPEILVNRRQEKEREHAISKSRQATEAIGKRYGRSTDVDTDVSQKTQRTVTPRAYTYESVSDSVVSSKKESSLPDLTVSPAEIVKLADRSKVSAAGFDAWWSRWSELTKRAQRRNDACRAWIGSVEPGEEPRVMACLERYGKSEEVSRAVVCNPDKWLYDQARDGWSGDWPPARASPMTALEKRQQRDREVIKQLGL